MKHNLILIVVIVLAAVLRLYNLSGVPPGINRDEASIGYTAASLIQTGRDEYGRVWPLSFESFGDWKLPLYIYSTIPFVKLFGLNELAVRLPSALAGMLTIFFAYFLVSELFRGNKYASRYAEISALFLAISPWHL